MKSLGWAAAAAMIATGCGEGISLPTSPSHSVEVSGTDHVVWVEPYVPLAQAPPVVFANFSCTDEGRVKANWSGGELPVGFQIHHRVTMETSPTAITNNNSEGKRDLSFPAPFNYGFYRVTVGGVETPWFPCGWALPDRDSSGVVPKPIPPPVWEPPIPAPTSPDNESEDDKRGKGHDKGRGKGHNHHPGDGIWHY